MNNFGIKRSIPDLTAKPILNNFNENCFKFYIKKSFDNIVATFEGLGGARVKERASSRSHFAGS